MSDQYLQARLARHAFLQGMSESHLALLAGCARPATFPPGQFLCREQEPANAFFLIQSGRVAIEIHTPKRGTIRVQTIGPGEVVGWSWVIPPHQWQFDARVVETVQALALDAQCLRGKCTADHELGYHLLQRLVAVIAQRLSATRLQLLDVYQ